MAVIQLKKVINVNPRMIKAYQLLALLYMEDQKYDQALDVIDRCLEIDRGIQVHFLIRESLRQPIRFKEKEFYWCGRRA